MTKEKQFSFLSKDGKTKIHAVKWMPESGEYRAVLQITHGMVEYIERYKPFAEFLNDQGVLVVGHDHLGHGASVTSEEELGYFAEPDPSDTLVEDMHTLRTTVQAENPGVPYFMMGHSMGSYMLRKYLCIHPEGVAGAVIMGTGAMPDSTMKFGLFLCRTIPWMALQKPLDAEPFLQQAVQALRFIWKGLCQQLAFQERGECQDILC